MRTLDDGTVAITYESHGGTVRLIDGIPSGDRPAYVGVGQILRLNAKVAKLAAFRANLTRGHMRLLVRLLLDEGFEVLYADRREGRSIPFATQVETGDFASWWRLDLTQVDTREGAEKEGDADR